MRKGSIDAAVRALEATATEVDITPATPIRRNGVYDPGILKAIFLAGGPGSGKSYTSYQLFGVPQAAAFVLSSSSGLKIVNSDPFFEVFLKQAGIDPKSLRSMTPPEFAALGEGEHSPRRRASRVRESFLRTWLKGRIGLIIDGTGYDFGYVKAQSDELRALGYDTMMLFVDTSLEVAMMRNQTRGRSLPDDMVIDAWEHVQANREAFRNYFGAQNFVVVNANKDGPIPANLHAAATAFVRRPVVNPIGRQWIADELAAHKRNPVHRFA